MMMRAGLCRGLGAALLLMMTSALWADDLLMVRSQLVFEDAQPRLEDEINALGYFTSNARRVDIDLISAGFSRGIYRSIAYGKPDEVKVLSERYPELTPFLPLQIVIFGERSESLLVALSPLYLAELFPQPELVNVFAGWHKDLQIIMENMRDAR